MFVTRSTQKYAVIALVFLMIFGGGLIVGGYYVAALGQELESQASLIKTQRDQEQIFLALRQELEQTQVQRDAIGEYLLPIEQELQFLNDIEVLMRSAGLNFQTINFNGDKKSEAGRVMLTFDFRFSGSREAVDAMLRYFETLPYKSDINRLDLTLQEGNIAGTVSISVTTNAYD